MSVCRPPSKAGCRCGLEDLAKNELGLSELEPYQVTYVNRCGGDKIVTNESTPSGASILEEITDTIGSALEYLRISFNKNKLN